MFNFKTLTAAFLFFVVSFTFPFGNAFAINCDLPCNIPLPPACEVSDEKVTFDEFTPSSQTYYGEVCHPNTRFNIYVTTHLFGSTISSYYFPSNPGAAGGAYLSGHPYYKIELDGEYHPSNVSTVAGALTIQFINNNGATMLPEVSIEIFDTNNSLIHSSIETPPTPAGPNETFTIDVSFATGATEVSHIHIDTIGKHGIHSIKYNPI